MYGWWKICLGEFFSPSSSWVEKKDAPSISSLATVHYSKSNVECHCTGLTQKAQIVLQTNCTDNYLLFLDFLPCVMYVCSKKFSTSLQNIKLVPKSSWISFIHFSKLNLEWIYIGHTKAGKQLLSPKRVLCFPSQLMFVMSLIHWIVLQPHKTYEVSLNLLRYLF